MQHWQKTLIEYLSPGRLVDEHFEEMVLDHFLRPAQEMLARDGGALSGWAALPGQPDIEYVINGKHDALLRLAESGRIIGGYETVMPWVEPEFRGRGLMSALHKVADDAGLRFTTANYTILGLMARTRTHGLHVSAALAAEENVPAEVLADYEVDGSSVRLREPMSRERYQAEWISDRDEIANRVAARIFVMEDMPAP